MKKFAGKYRIGTTRKRNQNYARPGWYCITICVRHRTAAWFGEVRNGIMGLSNVGCVVVQEIQKTEKIRSNIIIDSWITMPDHMHVIVHICHQVVMNTVETHRRCVSTKIITIIPLPRRQPNSLGSIVAQLKSVCTKRIRNMGYEDFAWQARYYDRIIRNTYELDRIRAYIHNNPRQWGRAEKRFWQFLE